MKHTKKLKNENTKKSTCLSCLKSFSKREVIGKLCIEEVRVDLEHLCSCSRKQCRIFHGSFSVNNYPLVYIHCIIKIMCQALVLGWLDCLFTMCRTKTETLAVARDFTFLTGKSNGSETFCTLLLYNFFKFSNLFYNFWSYSSLLNFQITTDCPVLNRFCFSCVVCLIWCIYG